MKSNTAEYSALRTELIHHDSACLTILGLLLAATTAIYGVVANQQIFPLLIMLSVIWGIGFLYIVEKRATIRRISFYIQTQLEKSSSSLGWEAWSRKSRPSMELPTVSPLKIERTLLVIANVVNTIWLWISAPTSLAIIAAVITLISFIWSQLILNRYYKFSRKNKGEQTQIILELRE